MHWTAESPYLYELTTALWNDNKVVESTVQKVGFREIRLEYLFKYQIDALADYSIHYHWDS